LLKDDLYKSSRCWLMKYKEELRLFSIVLVLYSLSIGNWITSNDMNCIYLANAFLNGRFNIVELPPNPIDLSLYKGKWYSPFPPLPSIIVAPAVYLLGLSFKARFVTIFIGSLNVILARRLLVELGVQGEEQKWLLLLFSFGSIHWFYSTTLFNHTYSVFFLMLAIYEALSRNNPLLLGLYLGCSVLCRYPILLSVPFFILMLRRDHFRKNLSLFLLGLAVPLSFLLYYNYARFGSPWETGYQYEINVMKSPKPFGLFDPRYIPANLYTFFLEPMRLSGRFPYLVPRTSGLALTYTTPIVFLALKACPRKSRNLGSYLSSLLVFLVLMCYFSNGADQFGYRYGLDFFPFLFLLVSEGLQSSLNTFTKLLIIFGVIVNLWGVLFFNGINLYLLSSLLD